MPFFGYIMIRLLLPPKLWYFIHHRETKEQENLKFLPEEQFFASLSHGIPPSSPFSYRDRSLVGLSFFPLILILPFIHAFGIYFSYFHVTFPIGAWIFFIARTSFADGFSLLPALESATDTDPERPMLGLSQPLPQRRGMWLTTY